MTTKQINDLISFVAMNAMNGVDNKRAAEWITEQNLDKDIVDHLQHIIDNINNRQQYVALIANRRDTYDRYWIRNAPNETLEIFFSVFNLMINLEKTFNEILYLQFHTLNSANIQSITEKSNIVDKEVSYVPEYLTVKKMNGVSSDSKQDFIYDIRLDYL